VKWFPRYRFSCPCCGWNGVDQALINRLDAAVDELAELVGKSPAVMVVTSGCRCEKHNREVGGAKNSYHLRGMAADTMPVVDGFDDTELMRFWFLALVRAGFRGVGYTNGVAIHADLRDGLPQFWAPEGVARKAGRYVYLMK